MSLRDKFHKKPSADQLMAAVKQNDVAAVLKMLQKGADPNARSGVLTDTPVLVAAAKRGYAEIVKLLLDDPRTNIDITDNLGITALITASNYGHLGVMKMLFDRNANIDAQDALGATALVNATFFGQTEAAKLLLDRGANAEIKNSQGLTARMVAVGDMYKRPDIAQLIEEAAAAKKSARPTRKPPEQRP